MQNIIVQVHTKKIKNGIRDEMGVQKIDKKY